MEIRDNIIMQSTGCEIYNKVCLRKGHALFFFAPIPQSSKIQFVANNTALFECSELPVSVKMSCEIKSDEDLRMVNANLSLVSDLESLNYECVRNQNIQRKDLDYIEGGMRILNTMLHRLKGDTFLEVNIAGLSSSSIESLLKYIIRDVSEHKESAYVVVAYVEKIIANHNPIEIKYTTIEQIVEELQIQNQWNYIHHFSQRKREKIIRRISRTLNRNVLISISLVSSILLGISFFANERTSPTNTCEGKDVSSRFEDSSVIANEEIREAMSQYGGYETDGNPAGLAYNAAYDPATRTVHVDYSIETDATLSVSFYSLMGKQVYHEPAHVVPAGTYSLDISLGSHSPGFYVLNITVNDVPTGETIAIER